MGIVASVVQSQLFQDQIERIRSQYDRIDDLVCAIDWRLSRSPEAGDTPGPPLGPKYRILNIAPPAPGLPRVWLAYSLNGKSITLEDIKILN